MKLSTRLAIIVICSVIGLVVMAGFSLNSLRTTMLEDRHNEIRTVLTLAANQVNHFKQLEKEGKLTRDEAQAKAIEAMSTLRDGKTAYIWMRTTGAMALVLPDNQKEGLGQVDWGKTRPDGRKDFQLYLDLLSTNPYGFVELAVKKPGNDQTLPKILGVTKIDGWDWVMGYGAWVDDVDAAFWKQAMSLIALGVVMLAVVVGLAVTMARNIYKRLGGEPDYAAEVAQAIAAGDLSRQLDGRFSGDSLLASIARMQASLRQMIESIQSGSAQLGRAASELSGQMEQIHEASSHSEEATASTAAAVEELAVSIDHISNSARETEVNSDRSSKLAEDGEKMVNRASETIAGVSAMVQEASGQIEGLLERSREIDSIAAVIKEIADQTNLLALNAAIEAARAGEQGRGFAVVADEVRKLAERTTQATDQITQMIGAVQSDTGAVVKSMQSVTPQVALGVEMATSAAAALREINDGTATTLGNVREVANATAEQSQASTSVAQNVERIAEMVEKSAASVRAANENVQSLESLANQLRDSVSRFRL
ncbi:methyl-accepting chemotaxis protein [Propionivibrio limicola]|uniref:methyl-accepting chemotaxis protein n=1 Tax=Propionivibrio limicola TaxID=167645 RepID=UPI0012926670|nr:methyl-accepting chemotaxis protein [Propionivibrio limicola]